MNNEKAKKCEMRRQRVENTKTTKCKRIYEIERFMKFLEVEVHYHEFEMCHMSSRFRRIMN